MTLRNLAMIAIAVSALTASLARLGAGQGVGQGAGHNIAATVTVSESLPWPRALAAVVRDPSTSEDLIVMRKDFATSTTLEAALSTLNARRVLNPNPTGREITTLDSAAVITGTRSIARTNYLRAILARLENAPISSLGKFGPGRTITITDTHGNR